MINLVVFLACILLAGDSLRRGHKTAAGLILLISTANIPFILHWTGVI